MTNKDINKEILALKVITRVFRMLTIGTRRIGAVSDRGAQSVDVAVWIGLIIIVALTIMWPQVQQLIQSLMAKWQS